MEGKDKTDIIGDKKDVPSPYQNQTSDDEINLLDYLKVILKHKRLIIAISAIAVAATIVISLTMTPVYESKTIVISAAQQKELSPMVGLAAQFGIATPASSSVAEIVNLLNSNVLRERIIRGYNLLDVFFKKGSLDKKSENEKIWAGLRFLQGALKVNFKQKDNIIEISMQFKDPQIAADILNHTLIELTNYMSSEAKRVAETNKKYLESQLNDTADPFIKTKIYNLIAQQIEQSMMAEVKENFAFKVIDPPKVPDKRIKPKRRQMVMISFVTSLFAGIFLSFFVEYVQKMRERK